MYNSFIDAYYALKSGDAKLSNGLCGFVDNNVKVAISEPLSLLTAIDILILFSPNEDDKALFSTNSLSRMYWGSDSQGWRLGELTTLRETILLFCAAYCGEL